MADRVIEELDRDEALRLISAGGIGRIAYTSRFGPTVLPVNYTFYEGAILFRTAETGTTEEDLRTGISHAEFRVAFEVDHFDTQAREGWSVLVQGPAHHLDSAEERAEAETLGIEPWPGGEREHFIRITPVRITGRRIRRQHDA